MLGQGLGHDGVHVHEVLGRLHAVGPDDGVGAEGLDYEGHVAGMDLDPGEGVGGNAVAVDDLAGRGLFVVDVHYQQHSSCYHQEAF